MAAAPSAHELPGSQYEHSCRVVRPVLCSG
jgi:hypothetical protein